MMADKDNKTASRRKGDVKRKVAERASADSSVGQDHATQRDSDSGRQGVRKDGKPYKEGNTRADGSYKVGDRRTPIETRFRKDDGRDRGRRPKGRKNLLTEWREELDSKVEVTENGKRKKISKRRMLIKSKIKRGIEKSDRAAETALRYDELSERRDPGLQADDYEIIDTWLKGILNDADSDDADFELDDERCAEDDDG